MPRTDNKPSSTANINEHRQNNKPIMEKKRRARINNCLNELKSLLLEAMRKDPAHHSKLEKADILEMTVKHLQSMRHLMTAMSSVVNHSPSSTVITKYRAGFNECATEVARYLTSSRDGIGQTAKQRLLTHLSKCASHSSPTSNSMPASTTISAMAAAAARFSKSNDCDMASMFLYKLSGNRSVEWNRRSLHHINQLPVLPNLSTYQGIPSQSYNNCFQSPTSNDDDQGFATNTSISSTTGDDQSQSPCGSRDGDCDGNNSNDEIVCIDDDDDGYVDHEQLETHPVVMPVNLSTKELEKMWRPW